MEPELQSRWIKKKEDISGLELVQSLHREGPEQLLLFLFLFSLLRELPVFVFFPFF